MSLRLATYNVENLFRRARILNMRDEDETSERLVEVARIQKLLGQAGYSDATRDAVFEISSRLVHDIDFRVDMGSLGAWRKADGATGYRIHKSCRGRDDWVGEITFKFADFSDRQRLNTAAVVKALGADVLCLVEVEGLSALEKFNAEALGGMYRQYLLIDSPNDPRGIDVGCFTKYPITRLRTHIFDEFGQFKRVFSRDCLEIEVALPDGRRLAYLLNHFKSQRTVNAAEAQKAALRRRAQATRVAQIAAAYDLSRELVAVAGDLNEDSSNPLHSLEPLFETPGLVPVVDPSMERIERWTHYYAGGRKGERLSQLDYMFVSKALHSTLTGLGFERRGIFEVDKATVREGAQAVQPFETVTRWDESASDHAGLVAEFAL
ncbi:MAG TPA: endonuclease/exonuclease/phosphatase family protein [Usitatibacter sp.]|nr:endonuclease/exonuclease/phosphatase family protein [Usitatibacter sp.]